MNLFYFLIIVIAIIAFINGIYIYRKKHSEKTMYPYPWITWFTTTYFISGIPISVFGTLIFFSTENIDFGLGKFLLFAYISFMVPCGYSSYITYEETSSSAIQLFKEGKYRKFVTEFFRNFGFLLAIFLGVACWVYSEIPSFIYSGIGYCRIFGTTDVEVCATAARDCRYMDSITISSMIHFNGTDYRVKSIGSEALSDGMLGNNSLEHIVIQHGITTIEDEAFTRCHRLVSIVIPESVMEIGDEAFSSCYSLTSITIPKNVKSLGEDVFEDCNSLETICFEGKTEMKEAFDFLNDCKNLSKVYVPLQYSDYYLNELLKYSKCTYHEEKDFDELKSVLYFYSPEEHEF